MKNMLKNIVFRAFRPALQPFCDEVIHDMNGHGQKLAYEQNRSLLAIDQVRNPHKKTIAHFAGDVFPVDSQTFIYRQIVDLERLSPFHNLVFCSYRALLRERPYASVVVDKFPRLMDLIAELGPALLHVNYGWYAVRVYPEMEKGFADLPLLVSLHGSDVTQIDTTYDENYKQTMVAMGKDPRVRFTTCSQFLKDQLIRKCGIAGDKITVTNYSYLPAFNNAKNGDYWQRGKPLRLLAVARLVRWKGHLYAIEALKQILSAYPDTTLTIMGEGEFKDDLLKHAAKQGVQDHLIITGFTPHERLPQRLNNYDIFLMPSITDPQTQQCEAFGVSLLEAIAAGLPVIATRTGGIPEFVGMADEKAVLVPEKDGAAMARAVLAMLEKPQLFGPALGPLQRHVQETYTPEMITQRYVEIYDGLTGVKPGAARAD